MGRACTRPGYRTKQLFLLILGLFVLVQGCTDADRVVVVNGVSSSMAVVDLGIPPEVINAYGGIDLGPSANRVAVSGQLAYVVNSGTFGAAADASIQVIDLASATLLRTIPLPDGNNPWDIALVSQTKAYVTNLYADSVTIVDPTQEGTGAIIGTIALPEGSAPAGIVVQGERAYTANTAFDTVTYSYGPASVSVIDTTTDTVVDADSDPSNGEDTPVWITGLNAQDLAFDPEGNLWVVCTGDWFSTFGVVDVVDPVSLAEADSLATGGAPGSIAIGSRVVVLGNGASASLFVIEWASRRILNDADNPKVLTQTAWSFVPDIVFDRGGVVAFALAFQDDRVFELVDVNNRLRVRAQHALAKGSGPAGVALRYP